MPMHYQADYWYRHESDSDQSVRERAQMTAGVPNATEPAKTIMELQAQGYTVQRVEMYALCSRCDGAGRIGKRPKGARKDRPYRPVYVTCPVCDGSPEYPRFVIYPAIDSLRRADVAQLTK